MQLPEPLTGKTRTLEEISEGASATLVMFICNHCPFVKLLKGKGFSPSMQDSIFTVTLPLQCSRMWRTKEKLAHHAEGMVDLAKDYQSRGLATVAISPNSVKTHPQDGPEEMAADAQTFGKPPYASLQVAMGLQLVMPHSVHGFASCQHRRHSMIVEEHACP